MSSSIVQSPGRVRNSEREPGLAAARHLSQSGLKSACSENCSKTQWRMISEHLLSEMFSVVFVFIILTATIFVLFHLNHVNKAEQSPKDVTKESNNNNKEVTANIRNQRVKITIDRLTSINLCNTYILQKSSFRIRKDAGTNTTFQSQDDELKVEKLKTKYQELLHSHDNVVRECKLLKNELEVVKFKHV